MAGPQYSGHGKRWCRRSPNTCCSKKILLLLAWQVLFAFSWSVISNKGYRYLNRNLLSIGKLLNFFCAPLVGWLADVKFGRYQLVKFGVMTSFLSSLLYFLKLFESESIEAHSLFAAKIISSFSVACFSSAIIPFLTDQLIGATSNELSTVVYWYYWAENLGYGLFDLYENLEK